MLYHDPVFFNRQTILLAMTTIYLFDFGAIPKPSIMEFGCSSCSLKILTFYEITPFPTTQHAKLCPLVVCFDPCLLVGMAVRASAVGLDFLVVGLYLWLRLRHQSHLPTARYCGGRLSSTPAQGKLFFCNLFLPRTSFFMQSWCNITLPPCHRI